MRIVDLGLIHYQKALEYQKEELSCVIDGKEDVLIFCQHPLTMTLGRKTKVSNIFLSEKELKQKGCEVFTIDRGGDVTIHMPGQMVMYPIIHLKRRGWDLLTYLHKLEQSVIDFLTDFDILAHGDDGQRGVWIQNKKIASIGIGVSKWVSFHGVAVNINNDMSFFKCVRPCGLDVEMISLYQLMHENDKKKDIFPMAVNSLKQHAIKVFGI